MTVWRNKLFYGDNLEVLREYVADKSVDLVYMDPPFNSKASYNVLFAEQNGTEAVAQVKAFEDFWHWDECAEDTYRKIVAGSSEKVSQLIQAFRVFLGVNDMMAYLTMMAIRMEELKRVLKPSGSIFVHCDPTASHYIKLLLDAVFGPRAFCNEIVWKRTSAHSSANRCGPIHDIILFYSRTGNHTWNPQYAEYDPSYVEQFYRNVEAGTNRRYRLSDLTGAGIRHGETGQEWRGVNPTKTGRHWMYPPSELDRLDSEGRIYWPNKKGGVPAYKRYFDEMPGVPLQDLWTDIPPISAQAAERLGYPTQKPEALLERIIRSASNEGDVVLDPFCGCGTAVNVAERLKRRWIGIDITHLAIALIRHRIEDTFKSELAPYEVIGCPKDLKSAEALAELDKYQFQWWACSLVGARPTGDKRRGPDGGVDGHLYFFDDFSEKPKKVIVSVKGGKVTLSQLRDLIGTMEHEKATVGAFICLDEPSQQMKKLAVGEGFYEPEIYRGKRRYPRVQILTIKELLSGKKLEIPEIGVSATFKTVARKRKGEVVQEELFGKT